MQGMKLIEEAIKFVLKGVAEVVEHEADQLGEGQLARAGEGAGIVTVAIPIG